MAGQEDEFMYDSDWPPVQPKGVRKTFTARDDKLIIQYLLKTKDVTYLKGYEIWKRLEHSRKYNSGGFHYHSLQERWRRTIAPSIERYGLNDAEMELLMIKPPGYFANKRKMAKTTSKASSEKKSLLDQFDNETELVNESSGDDVESHPKATMEATDTNLEDSDALVIDEMISEGSMSDSDADHGVESQIVTRASPRGKASASASRMDSPATEKTPQNRRVSFAKPLELGPHKRVLFQDVDSPVVIGSILGEEKAAVVNRLLPDGSRFAGRPAASRRKATNVSSFYEDLSSSASSSDESYQPSNTVENAASNRKTAVESVASRTSPRLKSTSSSSQDALRRAVVDTAPAGSSEEKSTANEHRPIRNGNSSSNEEDDGEGITMRSPSQRIRKRLDLILDDNAASEPSDAMERLRPRSPSPSSSPSRKDRASGESSWESRACRKRLPSYRTQSSPKKPRNSYEPNISSGEQSQMNEDSRQTLETVRAERPPETRTTSLNSDRLTGRAMSELSEQPTSQGDTPDALTVTRRNNVHHLRGSTTPHADVEEESSAISEGDDMDQGAEESATTQAETETKSPLANPDREKIMMSLRKLEVIVPWAEKLKATAVLMKTADEIGNQSELSSPFNHSVESPRVINPGSMPTVTTTRTATTTTKGSPSAVSSVGGAGPRNVPLHGTADMSSRSRLSRNSRSRRQPNPDLIPKIALNLISSTEGLLDINVTRRCSVPLPEVSDRWASLLRSLRTSVETILRSHDNTYLGPHLGCPGLLEYLDMWSELEDLIEKANSFENGTTARRWRESRISSHVSEIVSMPMCLPNANDTDPASVAQTPTADPSVICSQLRAPEWRKLIEAIGILRDTAMATANDKWDR